MYPFPLKPDVSGCLCGFNGLQGIRFTGILKHVNPPDCIAISQCFLMTIKRQYATSMHANEQAVNG